MHLYINTFNYNKICFEDLDIMEYYIENIFFTYNGIYKKYKEHYYKLNYEENQYSNHEHNNILFLVQQEDTNIIKSNPLTNIPFDHYMVTRKTMKVRINDYIVMVKELDNDFYEIYYFIVDNNNDYETILYDIGLFLANKLVA